MLRVKGLQSIFIANFRILRMHNNLYLQMYIHFLRCVSFTPPIQVFSCVASLWTSGIFLFFGKVISVSLFSVPWSAKYLLH